MPCKHTYVNIYMLIFAYVYYFVCLYMYISSCINLFFYTCKESDFFANTGFFPATGWSHHLWIWMKSSLPAQSLFRHFWAPPSSVSELGWTGAMPAIWPPLWGLCVTSWCCQIPFLQTDVHLPLTFTAGVGHQPQRTGQSLSWHEDWDVLWAREGYPDGFLHWGAG